MKRLLLAFMTIVLLIYDVSSVARSQEKSKGSDSMSEARRLWELAVAAKGGRRKLELVTCLAVFYEYSRGRASNELYVFPNKRWEWFDTGPSSKVPLIATVMDFEEKVHCLNIKYTAEGCRSIGSLSKGAYMEYPQFLYLLETKWAKPEILASSKDIFRHRSVDVIKVRMDIFEILVYLDSKNHLPIRISYINDEDGPKLKVGEIFRWYEMSDYRSIDGIMLPHRIRSSHDPTKRLRYEINPEYDPGVFTRKPDLSAGSEQWRPKRSHSQSK